jgi:integrase/recombinase XerD
VKTLFERFIRDRRYLSNLSENTLYYYENCFKALSRVVTEVEEINKESLNTFVVSLRERGLKPSGANCYIRGINVFLGWMHENGHIQEPLKIKHLKENKPIMKTFTDAQIKIILSHKPKRFAERRLHCLLLVLADTGIRIDEALTLERKGVDFDNLLLTVTGKGNKERIVPFSVELRKTLYRFLQSHKFNMVFPTRNGGKQLYDNVRRDFNVLMTSLGITGVDGAFHAFRRFFAKNYVRNGGNLFYLQAAMGHSSIAMTKRYVEVDIEDLSNTHVRTSILTRLR